MKLKDSWKVDKPRQYTMKQRHYFAGKAPSSQSYVFSSSCVWIWELDHKEGWVPNSWCFQTGVLEKLLNAPCKVSNARVSNQSILKEISPENSLEGLMLKLKLQYFGHLIWKANSLEKDPNVEKDWGQEEKGMTEDEMVGWHPWLNGYWASSRRWWRTEKPGFLQSMGSQGSDKLVTGQ